MKVLLVDDEPAMLLAMNRLLSSMDNVEVVGRFQQSAVALDFFRSSDAELVFLDIQIASDDGIELARSMRALRPDLQIVFTTSHAEYAIQAFDVYPLDYMVKPISRKRLAQTIAQASSKRQAFPANVGGNDRLLIRGLGGLEASSEQAGTVKWISKKSKELFGYLILQRGKTVGKLRILEDVFPGMPVKNAETYLRTAVYQLRKALAEHGFREMVVSSNEHYRLDLTDADVDFIGLEQQIEALKEIDSATEAAAIELEKRYTGELFEGQMFEWDMVERERLAIMYDTFATRLAEWLLVNQRYREALHLATKIASRNEFEESSALLLLKIHSAMGDGQSLQQAYEQYAQILSRR